MSAADNVGNDEGALPVEASDAVEEAVEWGAFYDEEGKLYYFNSKTEESSWEPPANGRFNPPPALEGEQSEAQETAQEIKQQAVPAPWIVYQAEDGSDYYYNPITEETQWELPTGSVAPAGPEEQVLASDQVKEQDDYQSQDAQPMDIGQSAEPSSSQKEIDAVVASSEQQLEEAPEPEPEPEIDPAEKRLQDARAALALPDSVLEPNVMDAVTEVVSSEAGNPQSAVAALIDSFHGQTASCGLLGKWLADLRSAAASTQQDAMQASQSCADQIRQVAEDIICQVAEERFTKETGDSILNLSKSEAAFLEEMMDSPRWRRLLIDLSAKHKDSAVLVYCLMAISRRGHHREIAKRVNQSEHFAVFNAMLLSELAVIGESAVSAGSDPKSSIGLDELVSDLLKACASTSYTYLYSLELLRHLAHQASIANLNVSHRLCRAVRKWEAICQRLETVMMDPPPSSSESLTSPLLRKRRLELGLILSDTHGSHEKRMKSESSLGLGMENGELGVAFVKFVRRHVSGIKLDDAILNDMLPQGLDHHAAALVGETLASHPVAIRALVSYLYKPGPYRLTQQSIKSKCARLLALATIAAQSTAAKRACIDHIEDSDEIVLTQAILQGSQLCEQVETMISFLVTVAPGNGNGGSSGQRLSALAVEYAPVALGVAMWAREFTYGKEFAESASFPTVSVSILSLVRIICVRHPFARADGVEIALRFLSHSNPDVSYKKINAIKEQSLRLLLILLANGEVARVIGGLAMRLEGTADIDTSLIRYAVVGIIDIVRPPVSLIFARSFGALLLSSKCLDAVKSTYFGADKREALAGLLKSLREIVPMDGKKMEICDQEMISTLLYSYDVVC